MVNIRELKTKIYDHIMDMGFSSLNLQIRSYDTGPSGNVDVEGQFDEFMGDTIVYKAVYNPNTKEVTSFKITGKRSMGMTSY